MTGLYYLCYNKPVVAPILATERGVLQMQDIISVIVSVMVNVIAYYICKWLDRNKDDN